jgi:hypothetical protein
MFDERMASIGHPGGLGRNPVTGTLRPELCGHNPMAARHPDGRTCRAPALADAV